MPIAITRKPVKVLALAEQNEPSSDHFAQAALLNESSRGLTDNMTGGRRYTGQPPNSARAKGHLVGVVLIPKQLRMEWTDAIMLDPELTPLQKATAGVIGCHFNRESGETFLSQQTIARILGVSDRAVQKAISPLEERGYLIIQRREIKVRESDGRRFYGGRGIANVYLPAYCGERLSARCSSLKLWKRIKEVWERLEERAAKKSRKSELEFVHSRSNERTTVRSASGERTNCKGKKNELEFVPTHGNPTDCNPRPGNELWNKAPPHGLGDAADQLKLRVDEATFRNWLADLVVMEVLLGKDGGELVIGAPSDFAAQWVGSNFTDIIRDCFNATMPVAGHVTRISVKVRT